MVCTKEGSVSVETGRKDTHIRGTKKKRKKKAKPELTVSTNTQTSQK